MSRNPLVGARKVRLEGEGVGSVARRADNDAEATGRLAAAKVDDGLDEDRQKEEEKDDACSKEDGKASQKESMKECGEPEGGRGEETKSLSDKSMQRMGVGHLPWRLEENDSQDPNREEEKKNKGIHGRSRRF